MRRTFVAKDGGVPVAGFTFGFAFHQQLHPPGQHGDLGILSGYDIGQIVQVPFQVGEAFFDWLHSSISPSRHNAG